jgi:hypothetical protein
MKPVYGFVLSAPGEREGFGIKDWSAIFKWQVHRWQTVVKTG